jgi:hypothetical protein
MAKKLLDQIQPKWHPFNFSPVDDLTHTPNRKLANITDHANKDTILFNPSVTSSDDLSHNFCIFTDHNAMCIDPAYRKHPLAAEHAEESTAHTAGCCLEDGYDDAQAGSGVWFGHEDPRNAALIVIPRFSPEPTFEPELCGTGPRSSLKFKGKPGPNRWSSLRFRQQDSYPEPV